MIKLQTFDNFLTPLRFFRPWKAVEVVNDDAAYHFFPPKWRQWLTPEHFIYLLLIISRTRTRPRLRIKGLYYSTITSICTWKPTVLLTYGEAKGKNQQSGKQNIHFFLLGVAGKRNLQYYCSEHNETCDIHPCMLYIYKFLSGTGQSENISELIHVKDFFRMIEIICFHQKC